MAKLLANLHIFIILYAGWNMYLMYETFTEEFEQISMQVPGLEGKLANKKKEKRELKNYYKDIDEAKQRIELVASEVEKIQKKFPSEISDTENLALIKNSAESINIKNIFLNPGVEENKGFYFIKKYEFKGMGTYLQFLVFFDKISQSDRLLNVRNVNLKRSEIKQRGRYEVIECNATLEAYRYNPEYKEDREVPADAVAVPEVAPVKKPRGKRAKKGESEE